MARLAAMEKLEYYPTPPSMTEAISKHIAPLPNSSVQFARLLDPCAGEGVALNDLRTHIQGDVETEIQTWANEIHPGRAAKAEEILDKVVCAPIESLAWKPGHGLASALFLNPPYDYTEDTRHKRMESYFLNRATQALVPGGLLIFIVPVRGMTWSVAERLVKSYEEIRVYRFPDKEYKVFRQVVVFGIRKREMKNGYADYHESRRLYIERYRDYEIQRRLPVLGEPEDDFRYPIKLIGSRQAELYRYNWSDEEVMGVLTPPDLPYDREIGGAIEVLVKPKPGMMANIIAGSNGGTMRFPGEIINGVTVRKESTRNEVIRGKDATVVQTEFKVHIVRITNEDGLEYYDEKDALPFLEQNVDRIAEMVSKQLTPYGEFSTATTDELKLLNSLSSQRKWPNGKGSGLYPDQKNTVIAGLRALERYGVFNCIAEMGYGKTTVASAMIGMRDDYPVLVVAPRHLLKKWEREIPEVVPGTKLVIVDTIGELQTQADLQETYPDRKLVVLMANTMIAYGPGWDKTAATRYALPSKDAFREGFRNKLKKYKEAKTQGADAERLRTLRKKALGAARYYPVCPECGKALDFEETMSGKGPYRCPNVVGVSEVSTVIDGEEETKVVKETCNAPLFHYQDNHARRWPLAQYVQDRLKGFFKLLIVDEVHQYKSGTSLRGAAYGQLSDTIGATINLTGTFYGGKASSVFYLLYRSQPFMRTDWEYGDEKRWVDHYGRIETIYKDSESTSAYNASSRKASSIKEIPGSSPQMMEWILKTSVFKSVRDLGIGLPPFEDHVVRLDMMPKQLKQYQDMESDLWDEVLNDWKKLSAWFQWSLSRPNSGFRDENVQLANEKGDVKVIKLPALVDEADPTDLLPKEDWLVEHCKDAVKAKRKVVIFVRQTGTRDIRGRLMSILTANGIPAKKLPDNIKAANREEWIREHAPSVFITNPRRVETGLDLVMYQDFVFYGLEYSLYTLWQASMRLHRPGQKKRVRGYYLVYNDTMEAAGIDLIGDKMAAGKQLYGDDISGALCENADGGSFAQQLYQQMKTKNGDQFEAATSIFGEFESDGEAEDELAPEEQLSAWAENDFGYEAGRGDAYDYIPAWMNVPQLYVQEPLQDDATVIVKLFSGSWTWYITEYDPKADQAFGLVDGHDVEMGYFSLEELRNTKNQLGLIPERDKWFEPQRLGDVREAIERKRRPQVASDLEPRINDKVWWKENDIWVKTGVYQGQTDKGLYVIRTAHKTLHLPPKQVNLGSPPHDERPSVFDLYDKKAAYTRKRKRRKKAEAPKAQLSMFSAPKADGVQESFF